MNYELAFLEVWLREWKKLDGSIREQFKAKLAECLETPRVPSGKLSGHADRYKIKLKRVGYCLVYEVRDRDIVVLVVAVGGRDRNAVYKLAAGP